MSINERLQRLNTEARRQLSKGAANAKKFASNPEVQTYGLLGAGALGLGATGLGALKAYSDQANAYLPTDPLAVAGRMASNLLNAPSQSMVGVDPLAHARNHVASAGDLVGTEEMLEALAVAEMKQMADERKAAASVIGQDLSTLRGVQEMIDARVDKLLSEPIEKADGNIGPMTHQQAQRIATEQIAMELRAADVY